ncbi:MAG: DUF302 domain-containing protein [Candidatus Eremiobacteraeota bacterium]|nr:DUF302 domain-containing protein [Candidatus Eremiobacteraeota bacterium]
MVIESTKPYANVEAFLEALIPEADSGRPLEPSAQLVIFLKREHPDRRRVVQYEIGTLLTTSTAVNPAAALYLPTRVVLYEKDDGGSRFEYDLPSSLFDQFGDDRIAHIGHELDDALIHTLKTAAG